MNTTTTIGMDDEIDERNNIDTNDMKDIALHEEPGAHLALLREKQGYSAEYVASKLHLRVCMIDFLEADDYQNMPEPVFIKGYLRAYANLLGVESAPLLEAFNRTHETYAKGGREQERTLWQTRRPTNKAEHVTAWVTGAFALVVLVAVAWWWSKSKDVETLFSAHVHQADASSAQLESDIRLTDLSNMRSLLAPNTPTKATSLGFMK